MNTCEGNTICVSYIVNQCVLCSEFLKYGLNVNSFTSASKENIPSILKGSFQKNSLHPGHDRIVIIMTILETGLCL